jgi:hypothetical protein
MTVIQKRNKEENERDQRQVKILQSKEKRTE